MILECESCGAGYPASATQCPYCNAGAFLAHQIVPATVILDTECYPNYWLCKFMHVETGETQEFNLFDGHPLDAIGLRNRLTTSRNITFNGRKYDMPMIAYALSGATNAQLKQASDAIIRSNLQPWQFYEAYHVGDPNEVIDHIDLFEVAPGQGSLKAYGGKMHSRKLQDLPIDPDASIAWPERLVLREYCGNDLIVTCDLYKTFPAQIKLREDMGAEYGVDLRSKSDAQIAETVMKRLLPFKVERPHIAAGTQFYYRPPEWLSFNGLNLLELLARSPFTITDTGSVAMTAELENTVIRIGSTAYKMGIGGLHSMESSVAYQANDVYSLTDHDVVSYYPSLIIRTGIFPQQIGDAFQTHYRDWYSRRLAAKHSGDKKTANSLKTLLNGTFGKLGSRWSIFYAPSEMIQVTVTGQLALLMLIEAIERCGIAVISANTDGIVVKCPRHMEWVRDDIVRWWERVTQFETEVSR